MDDAYNVTNLLQIRSLLFLLCFIDSMHRCLLFQFPFSYFQLDARRGVLFVALLASAALTLSNTAAEIISLVAFPACSYHVFRTPAWRALKVVQGAVPPCRSIPSTSS